MPGGPQDQFERGVQLLLFSKYSEGAMVSAMMQVRVLFDVKPLGLTATFMKLRSFETSANYLTVDMMCHPRTPDNSMIKAIKAEGDTREPGKRNNSTQDFSRKNGVLGRYRCKRIKCKMVSCDSG